MTSVALHKDTRSQDTGRYFCHQRPFSIPRTGNKVTMLSCGRDVLRNIYETMTRAERFIWIADWQMGFDIELVGRGYKSDHSGQLHKVIEKIISSKPVHVRVLLYASVLDTTPGTYDRLVSAKINSLNKPGYPGSVLALRQQPTSAQNDRYEYSHHQKFVVVDGRIGFIGGVDLSYGRWETPEFDVVVDPAVFVGNEMYNPCAVKLRAASEAEKSIFINFDFNEPYKKVMIEEGCQPRMPWQDVHVQIEGPSVVDLHRNFVRRWNAHLQFIYGSPRAYRLSKSWLQKIGAWKRLEGVRPIVSGGAQIQIIRSVSNAHLQQERYSLDDLELFATRGEKEAWKSCLQSWRGIHQDNILNAMVNCIRSADNYIYIETQFFISSFGKWRSNQGAEVDSSKMGNEDNGINNVVVEALAMRVCDHIKARTQFHVYLVIPVHPEGLLSDPAVMQQHRLALLTIKHGSNSLITRIKRMLDLYKRDSGEWCNYLTVLNMRSYGATVQFARDPITRNEDFGCEIGRFVVTEQIYVHSKLMIVDDAVAIIGSANINDRSLTGNGDSEIAAVIVDTEGVELRDLGSPTVKVQTRKFARELRQQLWMKHFGFLVNSSGKDDTKYFRSLDRAGRGKVRSSHLEHPPRLKTTKFDIEKLVKKATWDQILERPCAPEVIQAIQLIATKNAEINEHVFQHTPRNKMSKFSEVQDCYSLPYPLLFDIERSNRQKMRLLSRDEIEAAGRDAEFSCVVPPALSPEFMTKLSAAEQRALPQNYARSLQHYAADQIHDVTKAIRHLKDSIVGFLVTAPLDWGMSTEMDGDITKTRTVDLAHLDTAANSKIG